MKTNEEIFNEFVEEAKKDPNVIGLFLTGSRGKGLATKYSDYDIGVIVKENVVNVYKKKYQKKTKPPFGFSVASLSDFKKHAEIGSPFEWDRPSYTHVKAIIDKTGKLQKIIDEKGKIPREKIKQYVAGHLDGYINYVYRSLKCFRDGNIVGARLEAAKTIDLFLNSIFGLEGRVTPYYKYLEWELKNYPLKKFPMKQKEIIKILLRILETADIKTQQKLFRVVEKVFRKEGYSHVFDSWEPISIKFIKSFKK
jgi:predicted nucleotidyltransferase